VPAGGDPEHRGAAGQGAPERPVGAGGLPAGLVDVDDRGRLDPLLELGVRAGERVAGPLDDLVDRPARELDPEQLPGELGRVAAGDTVADRERHDRCLQPRPERRPRHLAGKLGPCRDGALRATHAVQPMLGQPIPALMTRLTTTPSTRPLPARLRRRRRRILRRRQRRVPRTPVQPPLKLRHPSLEPLVRLDQLTHPQQQRDRSLTITIKDPLRLSPLHTTRFAARPKVPSPDLPGLCHVAGAASDTVEVGAAGISL
jgi:hypothetical protein